MVIDKNQLSDRLFSNFTELLRKRLEVVSQEKLAKELNCDQSLISRWLSGKRRPSLMYLLETYKKLGGGEMSEVLGDLLGEERAAVIISVGDRDPEMFAALIELLSDENEDYEMLKQHVLYQFRKRKK